ncbi:uncharacterized protein PHACADRAFT_88704 [Phanerochaete carnosa HHB-10118-sp]|uniref:MalT-like TPR region domain-containing protein n=1 Tax=Phanerochaete carnosa (strain HHB-10118-sp) TaxID=650164 RepID=K5WFZ3_PHACS|nr:uncharacterized protein PHACADRAFT_88704 [Phanerochaete carnosa HHB-10118-sp]EKM58009.1 hypothetical protein PHACADRAFT_88704 [Phanerochaete carnosa HHB-10118-sp]
MFRLSSRCLRKSVPAVRKAAFPSFPCSALASAHCRHASTIASLPSKSRVGTIFTALILLGAASTAYGLYEFYTMFTIWPKEVRGDLRAGIKARSQEDLGLSERFLRRALDTAHNLPLEAFGSDPYLKLSGIAIALAGVLEDNNKPREAYDTYVDSLTKLRQASGLSSQERLRAVAVAHKLGEMAETYQQPAIEEEQWLVYAVEELLRILRDENISTQLAMPTHDADEEHKTVIAELELPKWVEKTDVIAPLQALGAFYNRTGKQEYAVPLYLSALNVLLPPGNKNTSAENKCRGADLMNSLADSLLLGAPTPERRHQAEAWVDRALSTIEKTQHDSKNDPEGSVHCELVLAAALFNKGSMREMAGDLESAKSSYLESRKQSYLLKQRDGIIQADTAIRRVDRLSK